MSTPSSLETPKAQGPSGFMEVAGQTFVVDYGKVYHPNGSTIGFLFEDGFLKNASSSPSAADGYRPIDEIKGCIFRGIDSNGQPLELPGAFSGPTGVLKYNGVALLVTNGRVSTQDHRLIGQFDDECILQLKDQQHNTILRKMDENTQLTTVFQGKRKNGQVLEHEFVRPLYRKDKRYFENEILRYFENFDGLTTPQKKFVNESLGMWARCGLLQVVRKSEGTAALGNVKHGASGVTGVRTGYVTLDKEEFEKEIMLSKRYGTLAVVATRLRPYLEVRLNQVVSHEYGHQLEFILSQATQDRITSLYQKRLSKCDKSHPLPSDYEGMSELLLPQQVAQRDFISGYARTSMHEYWAECTAAFSVKESRGVLKELDPEMHQLLLEVVFNPEQMLRPVFVDTILELQLSLRAGGELTDDLLEQS